MQALKLPARHGKTWLLDGFRIVARSRLLLSLLILGYWMAMALINAIPWLGQVVAAILIPVFSVGLMNACRTIDQGSASPPQLLFSGFHANLRTLLLLGALYALLHALILGVSAVFDGGVLFRILILGERPPADVLQDDAVIAAAQLALLLFLPLLMAFWYAPMLAAWHGLSVAKSLFFSWIACARNWRAFLVYLLSLIIFGAMLPGVLLALLSLLFGLDGALFSAVTMVFVALVLAPALYASFYVSYRDVFVTIDENA